MRATLSAFQEVERIDMPDHGTVSIPSPNGGKRQIEVGKMFVIRYPLEKGGYVVLLFLFKFL